MNNYNIISPFELSFMAENKKAAIKYLINKNYINNTNEYSNQVIIEDENKNKFNAQVKFYRKYNSHKARIKFIPTYASSVYNLPIYSSSPISPVSFGTPIRVIRSPSPVLPVSPIRVISPSPVLPISPIRVIRSPSPVLPVSPIRVIRPVSPVSPIHIIRPVSPIYPNPYVITRVSIRPSIYANMESVSNPYLISNYLTNNEISKLVNNFDPAHFKQYIEPKLLNRKQSLQITNNINTDSFSDIYITSDLHADYRKLVQILVNSNMISIPSDIDTTTNQIYDPRIITDSQWIKPNALFIIIGDLVDGRRSLSVDDVLGSFELLIHMLLYNLRIKAQQNNSDIIFTIGNHDLHSVLIHSSIPPFNLLSDYVHLNAYKYFTNETTRANVLKLFYNLSPYLFLNLNNNEIICVHGGLHNPQGINNLNINDLISIQNQININGLSQITFNMFNNNNMPSVATNVSTSQGALWTRFYSESFDRQLVCTTIKNNEQKYKFIIVGHCPTNNFRTLSNIMNNDTKYDGCDRLGQNNNKGCVVIDTCRDEYNLPVLAFVDSALSKAFRRNDSIQNENRNIELLHLHTNNTTKIPNRKYNVISRLEVKHNQQSVDIL